MDLALDAGLKSLVFCVHVDGCLKVGIQAALGFSLARSKPFHCIRYGGKLARHGVVTSFRESHQADCAAVERTRLFISFVLGPGMFNANVGGKLFIALPYIVLLHFIERIAGGRSRRIEHPRAFGATPSPERLFGDPY
jgi:hypothetical protein